MNFEHLGIKSKSYALCLQYKSSQKVNKRLYRWRRRLDVVKLRRNIMQCSRDLMSWKNEPEEEVMEGIRQAFWGYHKFMSALGVHQRSEE